MKIPSEKILIGLLSFLFIFFLVFFIIKNTPYKYTKVPTTTSITKNKLTSCKQSTYSIKKHRNGFYPNEPLGIQISDTEILITERFAPESKNIDKCDGTKTHFIPNLSKNTISFYRTIVNPEYLCKRDMHSRPDLWEEKYIVTHCSWKEPVSINFFETQKDYDLISVKTTPLLENPINVPLKICSDLPSAYIKDLCHQTFFQVVSKKSHRIRIDLPTQDSALHGLYEDIKKLKKQDILITFSSESKNDIRHFEEYRNDQYLHDKNGKFIDEIIRRGDPGDNYYPYYDFYQKGGAYYFTAKALSGSNLFNDRFYQLLFFFFSLSENLQNSIDLKVDFALEKEYQIMAQDLPEFTKYLYNNIGYIIQPKSSSLIAVPSDTLDQFSLKNINYLRAFNSGNYIQPEKISLENNTKIYSIKLYLTQEGSGVVDKFFAK